MKGLRVAYRFLRRRLFLMVKINRELEALSWTANLHRVFITTPVMTTASFVVLSAAFFWDPVDQVEQLWRADIQLAFLVLTIVTLVVYLIAWRLQKRGAGPKVSAVFIGAVAIFILGFGIWAVAINQQITSHVAPVLICTTIVGAFYYLRPCRSILLFSLHFVSYHIALVCWTNETAGLLKISLIHGFIATALGFSLSVATWRSFVNTRLQERKIIQQQAVLEQLAYRDPLTELPNRRLLDEMVRAEIKLAERGEIPSSLIIFDLDDFKQVNDTYGHPAGDAVLRELAQLLQESMRGSNTFVRFGGEEFVILAPNTSVSNAAIFAERLRSSVENHEFSIGVNKVRLTASFGVAPLRGGEGLENYYYLADHALYQAKQQGKNRIVVIE